MIVTIVIHIIFGILLDPHPSASCCDLMLPLRAIKVIEFVLPDDVILIPVGEGEPFTEQQTQDHQSPPHLLSSSSTRNTGRNNELNTTLQKSIFDRTNSHVGSLVLI